MNASQVAALLKRRVGNKWYQRLRTSALVSEFAKWHYQDDLPALASLFETDKWGRHYYAQHYQTHFERLRRRRINILEIGVGGYEDPCSGGESLRMWKAYFRNANVFGLDIADKSALQEHRIRIFQGSQDDAQLLENVAHQIGPLDIVIDDGSHINSHVVTSFNTLFPKLLDQGIYVIEDVQTAYWPQYGGSEDPLDERTSVAMCKRLVDGLNWEEFADRPPASFDREITSIHFYHNLAFIYKGRNQEGSNRHRHAPSPELAAM